jgi:hypothetical protein
MVAKPPKVALYIESSDRLVTSSIIPITTGWSDSCRVGLSPTEKVRVSTAHWKSRLDGAGLTRINAEPV